MANAAMSAHYDHSTPRQPVNLSLNEDLIARARRSTKNLSATVEELLAGYVQQEEARKQVADEELEQIISALNDFHERHGLLSDEFSTL